MRLLALSLLLLAASHASAEEKAFNMHFYAPFLEPALGGAPAKTGDEFAVDSLQWTSQTTARMTGSLWQKKAAVDFTTTADRKTLLDLKVDLGNFDVWRHRHSYIKTGQGYVWNSLEDVRPPLDASVAADYDAALAAVVRLWARRKVEALLARPSQLQPEADNGALDKPIRMRYDKKGLLGTASGDFFIRLWGVPVHVFFEVAPHTPTHDNPWIIQLAGPLRFEYAAGEWRRRHGYDAGYRWDVDFTEAKPAAGPYLDFLLERCAGYWSSAAASIIMNGLDSQLKQAIGWSGTYAQAVPALDAGTD